MDIDGKILIFQWFMGYDYMNYLFCKKMNVKENFFQWFMKYDNMNYWFGKKMDIKGKILIFF